MELYSACKSLAPRFWTSIITVLFCLNVLAVEGSGISLTPSAVDAKKNSWASFNCTLSCEFEETHTIYWFVGDFPLQQRVVFLSRQSQQEQAFERNTGIHVRIEQDITCGAGNGGMVRQTIRINATSMDMDRLPVQCAAFGESPSHTNYMSYYAVLRVQDPEPVEETEQAEAPSVTSQDVPTPSPVICQRSSQNEEIRITVTETVTTTVTLSSPTPTPSPSLTESDMKKLDAKNSASSTSVTLSLTIVGLLVHLLSTHWYC